MALSPIEQNLKLAIDHHRHGRFEKAETCYRKILKEYEKHPIANHNLGIIALHFGKHESALLFLKIALENAKDTPQFWISYIRALIYSGLDKEAKTVFESGTQKGINDQEFINLKERIRMPSSEMVANLMTLFKQQDFFTGAQCAASIIKSYPEFALAWKVLGACNSKLGNEIDAIHAKQMAAKLMPTDAEAHKNLGNSLFNEKQYLGASNSYQVSLRLDPNNWEVLNKLGVCMQNLGEIEKAKACYNHSLKLNPRHSETHKNLGNIYSQLRDFKKAELCYGTSVHIDPNYADGFNNLGFVLFATGQIIAAKNAYETAIRIHPESTGFTHNLGMALWHSGEKRAAVKLFKGNVSRQLDQWVIESAVYLAVIDYLQGDLEECLELIDKFNYLKEYSGLKIRNYFCYLLALVNLRKENDFKGQMPLGPNRNLYIVGESHALACHDLVVQVEGNDYKTISNWIIGCKQWHLGNPSDNQYKFALKAVLEKIPDKSTILLTFGEIDCRPDEGIIKALSKNPSQSLSDHVQNIVHLYLEFISKITKGRSLIIIIGGIPATNIPLDNLSADTTEKLIMIIRQMNITMKKQAMLYGFRFLDVYSLTNRGDGISNRKWHIDDVHLHPKAIITAFNLMKSNANAGG